MANQLSKTGITSLGTIRPWHVSQSVDALTGDEAYDIIISGSLTVTGSINGTPGVENQLTASYASTASYALNAGTTVDTGSFVTTSSFNTFTGSYNTGSFSGSFTGSLLGTSSWAENSISSSYALSSSYAPSTPPFPYTGSANITGSISSIGPAFFTLNNPGGASTNIISIDNGDLFGPPIFIGSADTGIDRISTIGTEPGTIQLSSTDYAFISGSRFQVRTDGITLFNPDYSFVPFSLNILDPNSNQWEGYFRLTTLTITGSLLSPNITGSLFGTSSWAQNALTSSVATSASYALSASYSVSSSQSENSTTSSKSLILSGSFAGLTYLYSGLEGSTSPGTARTLNSTNLTYNTTTRLLNASSSFALSAATASYVLNAISASYAQTASYVETAQTASFVTTAQTASFVLSSSYALSASYALTASYAVSASYEINYETSSSYADTASVAISSSHAIFADTASFSTNASDILVYVKNQSGNNIAKGVVVRITGSNNSSDIPRITTASYENDDNSANTLGITREAINNGSEGYVITEGILKSIDTSNYVSGQLIYLGPTGSIIGYAPIAPLHAVRLGEVVREQSINGSIYVRIDNGYEISELHDVLITGSTPGDLLIKSGSVWINSKQLSGSYAITGSLNITGSSNSTLFRVGTNDLVVTGSRIGIGTITPNARLDVSGSTIITGSLVIKENATDEVINSVTRTLKGIGGTLSVDWDNRDLYDTSQQVSIDWENKTLEGGGVTSLNWASRETYDNTSTASINWNDRTLFDDSGITPSVNWNGRTLYDSIGGNVLEWQTRQFYGTSSMAVTSSFATTASYVQTAQTASYVLNAISASYALTASYVNPLIQNVQITGSLDITGSTIFQGDTSTELVRITQTGTGDALRVEDSTNPDATPTVITSDGSILIGTGSSGANAKLHVRNAASGVTTYIIGTPVLIENNTTNYLGLFAPDANVSGIYMGSPSDSFGAVIRWGFNDGNLYLGAQQSGHGIRFTVGNKISSSLSLTPTLSATSDPNAILNLTGSLIVSGSGATVIGNSNITGSLGITQNISSSRAFISSSNGTINGSTLTVYGSGSTQPVFTVQGSQGELFNVTDSLSGSLFSVNDISSLPILKVSSDSTILWGSFQSPSLNTTVKNTLTNSGSFTVYSLPTSSYDGAWFEYVARSGSNARVGQIMTLWSASSVNFTETTSSQFGDTSGLSFIVTITGSNFALTGSVSTSNWTIKTIVRSI